MKNLTFQEKSLWLTLLAVVSTYVLYYLNVLPPIEGRMLAPHIFQFAYYMGVMAVFIAISHIVLAIRQKQEPVDERAQLINLKANSVSSYILYTGIFTSIVVALLVPGNFWFIHTINFFAVLAEVINNMQQLRAFRKGC
jgi:cytochrome b561